MNKIEKALDATYWFSVRMFHAVTRTHTMTMGGYCGVCHAWLVKH